MIILENEMNNDPVFMAQFDIDEIRRRNEHFIENANIYNTKLFESLNDLKNKYNDYLFILQNENDKNSDEPNFENIERIEFIKKKIDYLTEQMDILEYDDNDILDDFKEKYCKLSHNTLGANNDYTKTCKKFDELSEHKIQVWKNIIISLVK